MHGTQELRLLAFAPNLHIIYSYFLFCVSKTITNEAVEDCSKSRRRKIDMKYSNL